MPPGFPRGGREVEVLEKSMMSGRACPPGFRREGREVAMVQKSDSDDQFDRLLYDEVGITHES